MNETPEVLGMSAFARYIGRSASYASKLRSNGRLVLTPDGRGVRVAESLRLIADTRGARDDVAARWAQLAGGKAVPEPAYGESGDVPLSRVRASAEARRAVAEAEIKEIEAAHKRGDLIPLEAVETALKFVGATVRSQFDVFPDQVTPLVAPITALDEVHAVLQEACNSALEAVGQAIARHRAELAKGGNA